jgi:hypothetical protein
LDFPPPVALETVAVLARVTGLSQMAVAVAVVVPEQESFLSRVMSFLMRAQFPLMAVTAVTVAVAVSH